MTLSDKVHICSPETSLHSVLSIVATEKKPVHGLVLIADNGGCLLGVVNDSELISLVARGVDASQQISEFMNDDPITALEEQDIDLVKESVRQKVIQRTNGRKEYVRYIPVLDSDRVVVDVLDLYSVLIASPASRTHNIEIYGLGFVGITLAAVLAAKGNNVTGIDSNVSLVEFLLAGNVHVHEPRLREMLNKSIADGSLKLSTSQPDRHSSIVIIAVGSPISEDGSANLAALKNVCVTVSSRLRKGDIIMLRSTVPVGTTRGLVIGLLETGSSLRAGQDFSVIFSPERTVEGNAISELTSLPQIVGGLTSECVDRGLAFWRNITDSVIAVEQLESAELIKLINNSYRDLSFAFSNGLASLSHRFNIDASKIIAAANEGYPRNPMPRPSPGVGGYCLTKDPILYASASKSDLYAQLSELGRRINACSALYPLEVLKEYLEYINRDIKSLKVLVVGVAFKGLPETNDTRGSASIELINQLNYYGCAVSVSDNVVTKSDLEKLGLCVVDLMEGAAQCDACLIMNNHPLNIPDGLLSALTGRSVLLFDGWSLLDSDEVEQYENITYACMGYMTGRVQG